MESSTVLLDQLTSPEIADLDREQTVVLIPTGSTEQHGPHLPLDTDTFLCSSVARAAAERARGTGPVVVTPVISLGLAEHHMAFAGTLTLTSQTFLAVLKEVCHSLVRHGLRRQLLLNGHGGNAALVTQATQDVTLGEEVRMVSLDYWTLAREAVKEIRESPPGGMGHACEFETSLMLYLRPQSVRKDRIERELARRRYNSERFDMFESRPVAAGWSTRELSNSGVMGAPDLATGEKGERIFESCVAGLVVLIEELREVPLT